MVFQQQNTNDPLAYTGINPDANPGVIPDANRAPNSSDLAEIGTIWIHKSANAVYCLSSVVSGAANWELVGNPSQPEVAEVSITSAQVKALETTQIELVAAPGAGKAIKFLGAQLKLDYGGTNAFTESGDNLSIKYTDDSGVAVSGTIETTGFINQTADTYTNAEPSTDAIVVATGAENQALVLDNLGSAIAGNAAGDNTLEVSVLYRVVEI